jgi:flagellar biosynthesis protein FlhF
MDVRTYRAATMQEALALVRQELGPDAAVLHTREIERRRLFGLLGGDRQIEVTASAGVNVPSRLRPADPPPALMDDYASYRPARPAPCTPHPLPERNPLANEMQGQLTELQAMVRQLCRQSDRGPQRDLPETLFRLFTDLIEADLNEDLARELVEQVRAEAVGPELNDPVLAKAHVGRILENEISVTGPLAVSRGTRRLVALVGPTGVGKTTTIAKLAAHYRLKENRRVGLITVDTYRIAAVEQLRTYADIIDLPMQVVSSPREMREAVRRMAHLELVLVDTAGRSPKDDVKIRELRAFLTEAAADEVHLVLSSVANLRTLQQTAERFLSVGSNALILTKLDEATGLGNVLPLLRACKLPLSYLTNGQNVPDDIEVADPRRMARQILALESSDHFLEE